MPPQLILIALLDRSGVATLSGGGASLAPFPTCELPRQATRPNKIKKGYGAPYPSFPVLLFPLEREPYSQLQLSRVTHAGAEETVEIEKGGSDCGIDIVVGVESIEQLDNRNQRVTLAKANWSL